MQQAHSSQQPIELADDYFAQTTGVSWQRLIEAVTDQQPAGLLLRGEPVYRQIQEARRSDDPTLPRGPWEHELKKSDWSKVEKLCANAIAEQSKDLQLVAWLFEAQLYRWGAACIAPMFKLINELCNQYWDSLYPAIENGDLEFRTNMISWINEKLIVRLHLIPLTDGNKHTYSWSDWENASRNEQILSVHGSQAEDHIEGPSIAEFTQAMAASSTEFFQHQYFAFTEGLAALEEVDGLMDELCGDQAPSLGKFRDALSNMAQLLEVELTKRGHGVEVALPQNSVDDAQNDPFGAPAVTAEKMPSVTHGNLIPQTRQEAYHMLAQASDLLMRLEPHSPTPYLVKRAIEWGNLNTAQLYQELFIQYGGQLNIFDLLGIQSNENHDEGHVE